MKLQKLPGYTSYGGNFVRVLVHFLFSLSLIFTLLAATKFDVVPPTKNVSFVFFSLALVLLLVALHWPVALRSHFLRLSLSLYSKFVDMTINLSLILYITRIQKHFPLSIFVFIDSFDAGGHIVCFPAKITQHLASAYMRCVYGQVGGQAYAMS